MATTRPASGSPLLVGPAEPAHEVDMVAAFLAGELGSSRFGARLRSLLDERGLDPRVVTHPDTSDEVGNTDRRSLLAACRGWPDRDLFEGFPADVTWSRASMTPAAVLCSRYVDHSYWRELSGGTRVVADGADRVRAGATAFGVGNELFHRLARQIESGWDPGPLLLVGTDPCGPFTLLEGHARATALGLARPATRPAAVPVLLGTSPTMATWSRVEAAPTAG